MNTYYMKDFKQRTFRGLFAFIVFCGMGLSMMVPGALAQTLGSPDKLNVVWITVDALRADHLGCYGYEKNTSPFINRFAAEGVLFKNAFSQESYTQASVPSFFTSTYPPVHQVLYDKPTIDILDSSFITIAEVLKENGYDTAAFVFNPHLKAVFNFGQGFDVYDDNKEGFNESLPRYAAFETAGKMFEKVKKYGSSSFVVGK